MDNEATTFWASEFDVKAPVVVKLDLGATERIQELEISWEFPAKAFKVFVSDGGAPQQVFATSSNVLPVSRVAVGRTVNTIIVEMTEARARCCVDDCVWMACAVSAPRCLGSVSGACSLRH